MICEACHTSNPEGNRFCGNCGNPLALICPNCATSNPTDSKFCGQCGTALDAIATPVEAKAAPTSERRLVSVLFADLTGYTSYAEGRDAEDVRAFLSDYFDRSREVIERFGGMVEKFIGDAVMAVWGAETATEDDAELAVRAGLELVEVVDKLSADAGVPDLALRVGVHTGEAAVGPSDDHMGFVTGDLVNTASRLESAAEPGTVLVGEGTHLAASRSILFEAVGAQSLKGKSLPVEAWRPLRVVSERGGRGRTDSLEPPFVGRTNELRLLKDMLESVGRESRSRLISLVGEAGIGKSRLVWEFLKWIDGLAETIYWHEGRSPSYGDGVTFWAVAEMIKARAGIVEDDSDEVIAERLDEALETYVADLSDREWMRSRLLPVLGVGEAPPGERAELDAAVRSFFEGVASQGTTVLVFEDLHWADTALIDFVDELTDWWRNQPILVVTMARTDLIDKRPDWGSARQGVVSLTLGPLSDKEMTDVVTGTVPGIPEDAAATIVERAAGIPLYAVELLRGLLAQGSLEAHGGAYRVVGEITDLALPESLQAVIGARLDRLDGDDRALIQDAALLGHSFSLRGLGAITGRDTEDIESHLQQLSRRELIEPVRDPRSPERGQYRFLQDMIREVALGRMSRDTRRQRHLAAAEFFDSLGDPEVAVVVASHFMQALEVSAEGDERDAIRMSALQSLLAAVERASTVRAWDQVITISQQALEIAEDDDERVSFWEQMVPASLFLAKADDVETFGRLATNHHQSRGDRVGVWRSAADTAYGLAVNNRPDAAVGILQPIVEGADDLSMHEQLARVAIVHARAQMLNAGDSVLDWVDPALAAAESLSMTHEIADGLITKGTTLGAINRIVEAKILLQGAIALAKPLNSTESLSRAYNNLAYILQGIDWPGAYEAGRLAAEEAARAGDRGLLLFHAGQRAQGVFVEGRLEEAEALYDDPLLADPPPPIQVWRASLLNGIARMKGDHETADRLREEARSIAKTIDDPQVLATLPYFDIDEAMFEGDLERAISIGLEQMAQGWTTGQGVLQVTLATIGLARDYESLDRWIEYTEPMHPRFERDLRLAKAIRDQVAGKDALDRIDGAIGEHTSEGWIVVVIGQHAAAAGLLPGEHGRAHLETLREICTERDWPGYLELAERYLS